MSGPPDVVVVGAGVMGAWTALRARRAGWATTLIDAFGAGHPRATSGDETRICRASYGADPFYARWAREARSAWIAFGDEVGLRLFHETGMLWLARQEDGFEAHSIATLTSIGIPIRRLDPADAAAMWPQLRTDDLAFVGFEPEAGVLLARDGVAAVARASGGTAAGSSSPTSSRAGPTVGVFSTSSPPTGRGTRAAHSCSPPVRGSGGSSRTSSAGVCG